MSAMQEMGRDWWERHLNTDLRGTREQRLKMADEILSFASSREAKARREAIEEAADLSESFIEKDGDPVHNGTAQDIADRIRALLPSPATEKCEHIGSINQAGECTRCGAKGHWRSK